MQPSLIHELFEAQVEYTPHAVAALCESRQVTYQELNVQANQLAHHLRRLGVGPGILVAVSLERSLDMLTALLGILKAGGAYIPLETSFPQARVQWILDSLGVSVLITHESYIGALPQAEQLPELRHIIALDSRDRRQPVMEGQIHVWTQADMAHLPRHNPLAQTSPEDLAYIIFTSGSTGTPKGVMVCHQPVLNVIDWVNSTFQVSASDRLLFITSLCFDLSVYDIFGLLAAGGSIHIATERDVRNPEQLIATLLHEPVTFWDSAPAALQQLVPLLPVAGTAGGTAHLRLVFLSGDWIPVKLPDAIRRVFTRAQVVSLGGATEATIWSNYYPIGEVDPAWVSIPYGKPIQNANYSILDDNFKPCPVGVAGDLYIGGHCLATGYANEPELTAQKFLPDPFSGEAGVRIYKTGDLARFWPDGNMEFLGRVDQQVKVRGFRIELGEIETTLGQHAGLQEAVVVAQEYAEREKRLIAYLVPNLQQAFPVRQLLRLEQEGVLNDKRLHDLPNGMSVFHQNIAETEYIYTELAEEGCGFKYGVTLNEGDCVFDVGANIGLFSLLVGSLYASLQIYAFEPVPAIFELLQLNIRLYGLSAKLFACGLSRTSTGETLTYYPHVSILSGRYADTRAEREVVKAFLLRRSVGDSGDGELSDEQVHELLDERLESVQVSSQMRRLSEIVREQHIECIDLLKIDVEKSEQDVLDGIDAEDWPKIRQVMVEVYNRNNRVEQIRELLVFHGFEVAVEQGASLRNTPLYNLYAVRRTQHKKASEAGLPSSHPRYRWASRTALVKDVRQFLTSRLPEYMLPSAYVLLDAIPLTSNGKVDRKALPASAQEYASSEFVAPRTALEEMLATMWANVLGVQRVGINDNFFDLGGHSLLVTRVVTRVRDLYQVDVPLSSLFKAQTIANFARAIEACREQEAGQELFRIRPVARTQDAHLLSFPQEQVWFLLQLEPGNRAYHFQATLKIRGPLQRDVLERSLSEIIRRHEIFRTTFESVEGRPLQVIHEAWSVKVPVIDLRATSEQDRAQRMHDQLRREFQEPFALDRLPLIRWSLLWLGEHDYVLTHVEHHVVHDGWSFNTFLHELLTLYQAFREARPSPLTDLPVQFVDFVYWQRQWAESEAARRQLAYWTERLAGSPSLLELPTDHPRPHIQTFRGDALRVELSLEQCTLLRRCTRQEGCTLYMIMIALFFTLLYRYTGQEDICLGTGVANRRSREAELLIGMIINTLVLRTDMAGNPTFRELLARVREVTLGAYEHQDVPFEKIVEALRPERNLSYNPFFQVIFGFHDSPLDALELPDMQLTLTEGLSNGSAKFDLNVIVIPHAEQAIGTQQQGRDTGITMVWEYNSDLFERATIQRMIQAYQVLLENVCLDAGQRIACVSLLTAAEREQVIYSWNATQVSYSQQHLLHRLIEAQVEQRPEAIALSYGQEQVTYAEMNAKANSLAQMLQRLEVGPEVRVGICMERSPLMVIGMLAVLKAGGAYVPLDPDYPDERLAFMLTDADARVLLTQQSLLAHLPSLDISAICLDRTVTERVEAVSAHISPRNLAYVIYTSGSTGRPKGVQVEHQALLNLVGWHQRAFKPGPGDRTTQVAGSGFDAAGWEIWPALASGACLCLADEQTRITASLMGRWLLEEAITQTFLPTPLAESVLSQSWPEQGALRRLLTGGEALHTYPAPLLPFELVNNYGPTENTVVTTSGLVSYQESGQSLPSIGRPIANVQVYVLDQHQQPVHIGVPGELYVSGAGLARGYLNQPALTAERFLPNPFSTQADTRFYKTGDLVRYTGDGNLEFLGRVDQQVKLRGFRIELGEIEAVLIQHAAVHEAIVLLREDTPGDKRLVAYLVPEREPAPTLSQLRQYLQEKLPLYMLPTAIVILEQLPLTPNGKVDRRALPAPEVSRSRRVEEDELPRNTVEKMLANLWAEILGVESVGIHDNFFALGGHSLLATQVIARVQKTCQAMLPLRSLFEQPTVAELALTVAQVQGSPQEHALTKVSQRQEEEHMLATLDQLPAEQVDALLNALLTEYEGHS